MEGVKFLGNRVGGWGGRAWHTGVLSSVAAARQTQEGPGALLSPSRS